MTGLQSIDAHDVRTCPQRRYEADEINNNENASKVTNRAEACKERHECVKAHKAIPERSLEHQMTF
jgi:erythromycin esterase-like protein